jgi:hypothetical protein
MMLSGARPGCSGATGSRVQSAHWQRDLLASSASGSRPSSAPELPSFFLGSQGVTPSSTIAYAATMVKQSRGRLLYLSLMRR